MYVFGMEEPTQVPGIEEHTQLPGINEPIQIPGIEEAFDLRNLLPSTALDPKAKRKS